MSDADAIAIAIAIATNITPRHIIQHATSMNNVIYNKMEATFEEIVLTRWRQSLSTTTFRKPNSTINWMSNNVVFASSINGS